MLGWQTRAIATLVVLFFIATRFGCLSNLQLISNVLQEKPHGPRGRPHCAAMLVSAVPSVRLQHCVTGLVNICT